MSHLEEVDCVDCGRYIYATAEAAEPRCADCGRHSTGALTYSTPWPDSWTQQGPPADTTAHGAPHRSGVGEGPRSTWTVFCPRCDWTTRVTYEDSVWSVLRLHEQRAHRRNRGPRC